MAIERPDILPLVNELRPVLVEFSKTHRVSPIEMVSLLGTAILSIGIRLEETAGLDERTKTFEIPLGPELVEVIAKFGERHHVSPIEMLAILGATVIDLGAMIESEVNTGTRLN